MRGTGACNNGESGGAWGLANSEFDFSEGIT